MAHKTLIGGTAYEIKGGKCLVNGTGYSIKKGRTLVDGTGYDVNFAVPYTVTITGSGDTTYCYAIINGTKYTAAASGIEVMPGDIITFGAYGRSTYYPGEVRIDGKRVLQVTNQTTVTYEWTAPEDISAISIAFDYSPGTSSPYYGRITVTTS